MRHVKYVLIALSLLCSLPAAAQSVPQSRAEIQLSFAPLVKEAAPAVVNIYAKVIRQTRRGPFADDPFFDRFFREFEDPRPRVQNSLGSGVILSADGIVVSNYHVVGEATDIRVVLSDRREYEADVLLGDADSDLAVLKLRGASDLPYLAFRDSETVEVGELVLAIGNPFGVGQTVSSGIVSGLARSGAATGRGRGYFIQTDAPINPGNSGGALIDMSGRLIGINTSILTRSGGSNGIGFAIPADLVETFVAQARDGRSAFGIPWAGMNGQPVDAEMADVFGLERPGGIVVSGLHPASPFARAGVSVGDVILAVDGQPINTPAEMIYRMSVRGLGQSARVDIKRDQAVETLSVDMLEAPDDPPRDETVLGRRAVLQDMRIARINPAVISEFNLPLDAEGVVVVDPAPLGQRVGLRRGDVLQAVNDRIVTHPREIERALSARSGFYRLVVLRAGRRTVLQFRV
ncbi:MAG: trypsin-like peptidase domain-containing protein [Roseobacter sp.]